ncbi:MAG: hypothetical protein KGM17_00805 [Sphingomonadales bacterium]|nr:hypothetical protein [Sphingomonadales bacterium]
MEAVLPKLMKMMPFLFGIGFIAPCVAQILPRLGLVPPAGMTPVAFGLAVGGAWGLIANLRGRWL